MVPVIDAPVAAAGLETAPHSPSARIRARSIVVRHGFPSTGPARDSPSCLPGSAWRSRTRRRTPSLPTCRSARSPGPTGCGHRWCRAPPSWEPRSTRCSTATTRAGTSATRAGSAGIPTSAAPTRARTSATTTSSPRNSRTSSSCSATSPRTRGVVSSRPKTHMTRRHLMICSAVVAVVGLFGAALIYLTASPDSDADEDFQVVVVDGKTYRIPLTNTKMYRRELQRFGGEAAVLADDLNRWFAGLWRGKSRGITVAWITAFVSLVLFLLARQMPTDAEAGREGEDTEPG